MVPLHLELSQAGDGRGKLAVVQLAIATARQFTIATPRVVNTDSLQQDKHFGLKVVNNSYGRPHSRCGSIGCELTLQSKLGVLVAVTASWTWVGMGCCNWATTFPCASLNYQETVWD